MLKDLLGHARLEATLVYLRRRKKQLAMERVRDLSWGSVGGFVLQPDAVEAHTGFEPVIPASADPEPSGHKQGAVTPPGVIEEGRERSQSPEHDLERNAALSPSEFKPAVPEPLKSRLLQLMGKPAMTPDEIKHEEYLAKRRDQWRRRQERKAQEALERDRD